MGIVSAALQYLCTTSYPARHIVLSGYFSSIGLDFHHQVTEAMEEAADNCLLQQGVLHLAEKPMRSLSSGEARRVLLARATVHDPQVMLLDEAVSNLDLPAKKSYRESLERFAHEGRTIILVTHDLSEIIGEIGRVVVLKQGRIIADGPKRDVLSEELLSEAYGTGFSSPSGRTEFNACVWPPDCILDTRRDSSPRGGCHGSCFFIVHSPCVRKQLHHREYLQELLVERGVDARALFG
jgi:ABC-type cobalamin/Fe3+-siderophores transport system ATPase subunit